MVMKMAVADADFSTRLLLLAISSLFIVAWVRYFVATARPGASRLIRVIPIVPLLFFLSSLFSIDDPDESAVQVICVHTFLWMVPSKIISFSMNRGQLVKSYECGHNTAFAVGMLCMLTVTFEEKPASKKQQKETHKRHAYQDVRFEVKQLKGKAYVFEASTLAFGILIEICCVYCLRKVHSYLEDLGHSFLVDVCLALLLYNTSTAIHDIYSLATFLSTGLKLKPSFKYPFLAQSMQELWSQRYNLVMGESLRDLIYDPICEGCCVRGSIYYNRKSPSLVHSIVGTIVTFAFSGFIHSAVLHYMIPEVLFIRLGFFFVACSLVVTLESVVKRHMQSSPAAKWIPSWIRVLYTFLITTYLAHLFFLPDFHKVGFVDVIKNGLFRLLHII